MSRASLTKFSDAILNEAEMQKKELLSGLEKRREEELSKIRREFSAQNKERINSEIKKMEDESRNMVSMMKNKAFKTLINARKNMLEEVFDGVEKTLREYTRTERYHEFLYQSLDKAMKRITDGTTVCEVQRCDLEFMTQSAKKYSDLEIVCSKSDFIGGFIIKNMTARLYIDNTLSRLLEIKKQEFYKNNELVIER